MDRWHDQLDAIVAPLTQKTERKIRRALPSGKATQFIEHWPRIGDVAWCHGARCHAADTRKGNAKPLAKEAKALKTALKALKSINEQLEVLHKHWVPIWKSWFPFDHLDNPETVVHAVKGLMEPQQTRVKTFITHRGGTTPARRGRPPTAEFYLLETLLAYFRYHEWDDTITPHNRAAGPSGNPFAKESPFVKTAFAVLGGDTMPVETRRALKDSARTKLFDVRITGLEIGPRLTVKKKRELLTAWRR
jgi:hypothetical protein